MQTINLSSENILYIISISFQIAGALLLLSYSTFPKRETVIKRFIGKGLLTREGDIVKYNHDAYKNEYFPVYLNKLSFGYIAGGYLLNIFGNIENACKWLVFICVLFSSALIMLVSIKGSSFLVKLLKANDRITNDDLKKFNIKPDVEYMTSEETIQIWENAKRAALNDEC